MAEERPARCFMYSPDCPGGRIFEGADAIEGAYKDGWVDSPATLTEAKPVKAPPKKKAAPAGGKKAATSDDSK